MSDRDKILKSIADARAVRGALLDHYDVIEGAAVHRMSADQIEVASPESLRVALLAANDMNAAHLKLLRSVIEAMSTMLDTSEHIANFLRRHDDESDDECQKAGDE